MEKREHQRRHIEGLLVDIADGYGFFQGVVADVSRSGMCMTDLSEGLNGDVAEMTVIVSGQDTSFKMNVKPRWYTDGGLRKTIGVEVVDAPMGWADFVKGEEPIFQQVLLDEMDN